MKMVQDLVKEAKEAWIPIGRMPGEQIVPVEETFSEDEDPLGSLVRSCYMKTSLFDKQTSKLSCIKYQFGSISEPLLTARRKLKLAECTPIGLEVPDEAMICSSCIKSRSKGE